MPMTSEPPQAIIESTLCGAVMAHAGLFRAFRVVLLPRRSNASLSVHICDRSRPEILSPAAEMRCLGVTTVVRGMAPTALPCSASKMRPPFTKIESVARTPAPPALPYRCRWKYRKSPLARLKAAGTPRPVGTSSRLPLAAR